MTTQFNRDQTVVLIDQSQYVEWVAQLKNKCAPLRVWHIFDPRQLAQPLVKPHAPDCPEIDGYQPSTAVINAYTTQHQADHPDAAVSPFVPLCISNLSNNGKASYKKDVEEFKGRFEAYKMKESKFQRESTALA
jgi:hypothetical protein